MKKSVLFTFVFLAAFALVSIMVARGVHAQTYNGATGNTPTMNGTGMNSANSGTTNTPSTPNTGTGATSNTSGTMNSSGSSSGTSQTPGLPNTGGGGARYLR